VGRDDDGACVEHVWQLTGVVLQLPGSLSTYECVRCGAVLPVDAGEPKPGTV
jgi:hypothetical protein